MFLILCGIPERLKPKPWPTIMPLLRNSRLSSRNVSRILELGRILQSASLWSTLLNDLKISDLAICIVLVFVTSWILNGGSRFLWQVQSNSQNIRFDISLSHSAPGACALLNSQLSFRIVLSTHRTLPHLPLVRFVHCHYTWFYTIGKVFKGSSYPLS